MWPSHIHSSDDDIALFAPFGHFFLFVSLEVSLTNNHILVFSVQRDDLILAIYRSETLFSIILGIEEQSQGNPVFNLLRNHQLFFTVLPYSFLFIYLLWLFRAAPVAYGSSQARVKSELQLLAYTTARDNAGSVTH